MLKMLQLVSSVAIHIPGDWACKSGCLCSSQPLNEERRSCKVTGVAVAKLLRRLDLITSGKPEKGDIVLSTEVLVRWKRLAEK